MKTNEKGKILIKQFESFQPNLYVCPGGKKTIGYGHVMPDDTYENMSISRSIADEFFEQDLEEAEQAVNDLVKVPLNENQFSALVSFVFNLGRGNLASSTLLKKLNDGDYQGAGDEFGKWVYAKGKKLNGLIVRRASERSLFLES